jgi:hypothetical protein
MRITELNQENALNYANYNIVIGKAGNKGD